MATRAAIRSPRSRASRTTGEQSAATRRFRTDEEGLTQRTRRTQRKEEDGFLARANDLNYLFVLVVLFLRDLRVSFLFVPLLCVRSPSSCWLAFWPSSLALCRVSLQAATCRPANWRRPACAVRRSSTRRPDRWPGCDTLADHFGDRRAAAPAGHRPIACIAQRSVRTEYPGKPPRCTWLKAGFCHALVGSTTSGCRLLPSK